MCIDDPESTTNSLSSGLILDGKGKHHFSVSEKNAGLCFSFNFRIFFASLHAAAQCTLCLPETDPQIQERWDHAENLHDKFYWSTGFGLVVWHCAVLLWKIWHIGLVSSWLSSSVKSKVFLAAPRPEMHNPNSLSLAIEQLHFCRHFSYNFCKVVPQPGCVRIRTYPRICSLPQMCRMNTLGNATFHKKDPRKNLSDGPCMACDWVSQSGFGLQDISFLLNLSHLAIQHVLENERAESQAWHAYLHRAGKLQLFPFEEWLWLSTTNNRFLLREHDVAPFDSWQACSIQFPCFWPQKSLSWNFTQ